MIRIGGVKQNITLNDLVSIFLVLWILNPMTHDYMNPLFVVVIAAVWFLFAYLANRSAMKKAMRSKAFLISWIYPCFMVLYVAVGHARLEKSSLGAPLIVLFYMYCYYKNDYFLERLIIWFTIAFFTLMMLFTLYELTQNPYASRLLAGGDTRFVTPLTAGYTEVYYLLFFAITLVGVAFLYKNVNTRIAIFLYVLFMLFFFVQAMYTIALLLFALGVFIARYDKVSFWVILAIIFVAILVLFLAFGTEMLGKTAYFVSNLFHEGILKNRIIQVGDFFSSGESRFIGNNGVLVRLNLYSESFRTFISNFWFGVGDESSVFSSNLVGGHSTFLDRLAEYGIFGGGLYIITRMAILVVIGKTISLKWKHLYRTLIIIFAILSILNTTNRNSLLLLLICIVPFFLNCFDREHVQKSIES